jgi:hypothetical protein
MGLAEIPQRLGALTRCRRPPDRSAGCLERLPGDGHVVTEREPEADGADAPDRPPDCAAEMCRTVPSAMRTDEGVIGG